MVTRQREAPVSRCSASKPSTAPTSTVSARTATNGSASFTSTRHVVFPLATAIDETA